MKDYYYILGLEKEASTNDIKVSYRKLSKKFHPDLNEGDDFFVARFRDIQEAYEMLSDPLKRKDYDQQSTRTSHDQSSKNFQPVINLFKSSKSSVGYNEEVTFTWECFNSDYCELFPFGQVNNIGSKTVRLKDYEKPSLTFKLIAVNQYINYKVERDLTIINSTFESIKERVIRDYEKGKIKEKLFSESQKRKNDNTEQKEEQGTEIDNDGLKAIIFTGIIFFIIYLLSR